MIVETATSDLEGVVVEIQTAGEFPEIFGRIVATRLEQPPKGTLRDAMAASDRAQMIEDGETHELAATGAARRQATNVRRSFAGKSPRIEAILALSITPDALHQISFAIGSYTVTSKVLEHRIAKLLAPRAIRAEERAELERRLGAWPDWSATLVDRRVPMKSKDTRFDLFLCSDGTYRTADTSGADVAIASLPARGKWRISHQTLQLDVPKQWHVDGIVREVDGISVGAFGRTIGLGPFEPTDCR